MAELKMTPEEGREIVFGDNPDFETVLDEVEDTARRWSETRVIIVKRLSDNTYWRSYYSRGKTELQEEHPYEWENEAVFTQVIQKMVIERKWVAVDVAELVGIGGGV